MPNTQCYHNNTQPTTESSRSPGDDFKVHLGAQLDFGCVHFEDIVPSFDIGEGDGDGAVEPSRSDQSSEVWTRVWVMEEEVWVMEEGVWVMKEGV